MRVLLYSGNFYPEKTGIGKYSGELAAWMSARGHEVTVVTGHPYYPEWKLDSAYSKSKFRSERWGAISVYRVPHYIPNAKKVNAARRILLDLSLFLASSIPFLKVCLKRSSRPEVIVAVCPPFFFGFFPLLCSRLFRIPWIYHIQDFQIDAAARLGMLRHAWLNRLLAGIERRFIRGATRVSSISPAMLRLAQSKGARPEQLLSLPNWSDVESIKPAQAPSQFREQLQLAPECRIFMYAGAMGAKQGLGLVLDAAERLAGDPRCFFLMIGAGSDAEALRASAKARSLTNLAFYPPLPTEQLNDLLAAADVHMIIQRSGAADLVMPSKLTNALASGKPVIVTADPNTDLYNVVSDAMCGLVVPPEDVDATVSAIKQFAAGRLDGEQMGANARRYALRYLNQETILLEFENVLYGLTNRPGRPKPPELAVAESKFAERAAPP